jgi:hypothetical protein
MVVHEVTGALQLGAIAATGVVDVEDARACCGLACFLVDVCSRSWEAFDI